MESSRSGEQDTTMHRAPKSARRHVHRQRQVCMRRESGDVLAPSSFAAHCPIPAPPRTENAPNTTNNHAVPRSNRCYLDHRFITPAVRALARLHVRRHHLRKTLYRLAVRPLRNRGPSCSPKCGAHREEGNIRERVWHVIKAQPRNDTAVDGKKPEDIQGAISPATVGEMLGASECEVEAAQAVFLLARLHAFNYTK